MQQCPLEDVGEVDLVFDVIGGDVQNRSAALSRLEERRCQSSVRSRPRPAHGLAVDFVVEAHRDQLGEIVQRVRDGRLRTNIGTTTSLDDAVAALKPAERPKGKRRSSAFARETWHTWARERPRSASSTSIPRPAPPPIC